MHLEFCFGWLPLHRPRKAATFAAIPTQERTVFRLISRSREDDRLRCCEHKTVQMLAGYRFALKSSPSSPVTAVMYFVLKRFQYFPKKAVPEMQTGRGYCRARRFSKYCLCISKFLRSCMRFAIRRGGSWRGRLPAGTGNGFSTWAVECTDGWTAQPSLLLAKYFR
jgi:hypothetical protein